MPTKTKGEIVTEAYAWLRISGLTTVPTPGEVTRGLTLLEAMAYELDSRNVCTNYVYEDSPDPSTQSGIDNAFWWAAAINLGARLAPFFGKVLSQDQSAQARGAISNWASRTSITRPILPPSRQPRGSGNTVRLPISRRFYPQTERAPISCKTEQITLGAINDYTYSFADYLKDGETILTLIYESSGGLTVTAESLADDLWSYTLECSEDATSYQTVTVTINTSSGRRQAFTIDFNVVLP